MLRTVRMLRRLLRNAFFVTNRDKVIGALQGKWGTGTSRYLQLDANSIVELVLARQPRWNRFLDSWTIESPTQADRNIFERRSFARQWRSSPHPDDKCHP